MARSIRAARKYTKRLLAVGVAIVSLFALNAQPVFADALRINEIQFVGSHNSYKKPMSPVAAFLLKFIEPKAALTLDYYHIPIADQLDLGMRILELDVFFEPDEPNFSVGHLQLIDMNSHCSPLKLCLEQIRSWSEANPTHVPIWILFNAKDTKISNLPDPAPFTPEAFDLLDQTLVAILGDLLIRPDEIDSTWPFLDESLGKFLLILDEGPAKRAIYNSRSGRPMFTHSDAAEPPSIKIINDPVAEQAEITRLVRDGHMVRTRADADTIEARNNDVRRKNAAFRSGAQAISTDYYLPATHVGTSYSVTLPVEAICNPVAAQPGCQALSNVR